MGEHQNVIEPVKGCSCRRCESLREERWRVLPWWEKALVHVLVGGLALIGIGFVIAALVLPHCRVVVTL